MNMTNTENVSSSNNVKDILNSSVARIISNAMGEVIIEVAKSNSLMNSDIEEGDAILIDTAFNKPHTGGDIYYIDCLGYKRLVRLMLLPNNQCSYGTDYHSETVPLSNFEVVGKMIGKIAVRNH